MKIETNTTRLILALTTVAVAIATMAAAIALFSPARVQTAYAATEMLDSSRTGSISITPTTTDNKTVSGTVAIYRVAEAKADDTGWHFQWTDAYKGTDSELYNKTGKLTDSYAASLASKLDSKVKNPYKTAQATSGKATSFKDLPVGLYLVKMTDVEKNYDGFDAFLVSVPQVSGDSLVYNVNASPKAGALTAPKTPSGNTPGGNTPGTPGTPGTGTPSDRLPQTGQLWWPVFVLIGAGAVLIVAGLVRRRSGKNHTA